MSCSAYIITVIHVIASPVIVVVIFNVINSSCLISLYDKCYLLLIELAATQASHLESVQSELSASKQQLEVIV